MYCRGHSSDRSARWRILGVAVVLFAGSALLAPAQQLSQDEAALLLLNSARRAYNEQNCPVSAERFREFLRLYGGHREAVSAHYGLGLSLLELPQNRDYAGAVQSLQLAANAQDFPDRPTALYYLGSAFRGLGYQALAEAAKPDKAPQAKAAAAQNFTEAVARFAAAATAFADRSKAAAGAGGIDFEWSARAQADRCEMLLQLAKYKEAADLAETVLADRAMAKSQYRERLLYHLGYAKFASSDYPGAGRVLSQLAPFLQDFGLHARYLLGRIHHLSGERPEAAVQYLGVLADYDRRKKAAQEAMKNPAALKPEQRAAMEALLAAPFDDILRAMFYAGLVACEQAKYSEALEKFTALVQQNPKSSLVPEAQLRQGFCLMQTGSYPQAIAVLQPLGNDPQVGDQATWWLARSQIRGADPANPQTYPQTLKAGCDTLRRAADRAGQLGAADPAAKVRRGDILLELGDTLELLGQHKDAAAAYQAVLAENNNPDLAEEATQRQITALQLAGLWDECEALCAKFEKAYPKSTLLPAVCFRHAENAYWKASSIPAVAPPGQPSRVQEANQLFAEAIRRYQRLIADFPDFPYANVARYRTACAYYALGRHEDSILVLTSVPESDRVGELANVPYLLADCLIRTLPAESVDALQAGRIVQRAEQAARLLEKFVAEQGTSPQAPDALFKLGYCSQRLADVIAEPAAQQRQLAQARATYERLMQQFGQSPLIPTAVFERAVCLERLNDINGAMSELGRFQADPLRTSPMAPLASLRLAGLLRTQKRPAEAAALLQQARGQHEAALLKDPARSHWVPRLQYEHGMALKESGKLADARTLFDGIAKDFSTQDEALHARWRAGQCRREELTAALTAARAVLLRSDAKPEETAAAARTVNESLNSLRETADALEAHARNLAKKAQGSEAHVFTLYEAAWCWRVIAETEIERARQKMQRDMLEDTRARLAKQAPAGSPPPALSPPDIPLSSISVRPSERSARELYKALIEAAPTAPLSLRVRLELAEMLTQRAENDAALELLKQAVEKDPPRELQEPIRLSAAALLLARNEAKSVLEYLEPVLKNDKSPHVAQARYLAGEAYILTRDWAKATENLVLFRDQAALQRVPSVSDRALLALSRVYAQSAQWEPCRQALSALVERFPASPWVDEALYQIGWSLQVQNQHDPAVAAYEQLKKRSASEWAAKAQCQIGLCRIAQKRHTEAVTALLVVPFTYDYPECSATALAEAARAYVEMKQPDEAAKLWRRLASEYPASPQAAAARQKLREETKASPRK